MESLCVVIPAYNEEENIESVVKDWYVVLQNKSDNSRLVVADSGSTDRTHRILLRLKEKYPKLVIFEDTGISHGSKLISLYKYAIDNNINYVFQTDSDGQTNPQEFDKFWQQRSLYDGIFGCRISRGDGNIRKFVENVVCFLLKLYFGVNIPDANAPFRLMSTKVLKKYIHKIPLDYNLPNVMITTYFVYYNEKYKFMPITFQSRQGGSNSINIYKIIKIGFRALFDFISLKRDMP